MTRRGFLRCLGITAVSPIIIPKVMVAVPELPWKCVINYQLKTYWFQTTRVATYHDPKFAAEIDRIFLGADRHLIIHNFVSFEDGTGRSLRYPVANSITDYESHRI